ncbi:MAG: ArsR/SmtB family transcription factor [Candidatus Micrarchaeia archaeon]
MINEKKIEEAEQAIKNLSEIVISTLLSLDSRLDYYILLALSEGEKRFTELVKELDIDDKTLEGHLKKLVNHGIIDNYYKDKFFNPDYSFYALSSIGRKIVRIFDYVLDKQELKKEIRV